MFNQTETPTRLSLQCLSQIKHDLRQNDTLLRLVETIYTNETKHEGGIPKSSKRAA